MCLYKFRRPGTKVVLTHRYSVPKLWQQAVVGIQRRTSSCRLLFSGAVAFLWERERIRTEDAIRFILTADAHVSEHQLYVGMSCCALPCIYFHGYGASVNVL